MEEVKIDHLNGNNHLSENKNKRKKEKKEKRKEKHNKSTAVEDVTVAHESSAQAEEVPTEKRDKKKQKKSTQNEATDSNDLQMRDEEEITNENKDKHTKKEKKHKKEKSSSEPHTNGNGDAQNGHSNGNSNGKTKPATNGASSASAEAYRQANGIVVSGDDSEGFNPVENFSDAPFSKELIGFCKDFKNPTPIQAQCWPVIAANRDIVAIAETGSGKTIAFSLPVLEHIKNSEKSKKTKAPLALILSPTRELAMQIAEVTTGSGKTCNIHTVCLYGGVGKDGQVRQLKQGPQVVVATPGRLLDLLNDGVFSLGSISYLVLDEADRMLDLGFERDIRAIIKQIPTQRQTCMFSATWPTSIQNLASEFLKNPVKVTIGSEDLSANHRVNQIVEVLDPYDKERRLETLLKDYHKSRTNRILIFALYKKEAARLEEVLIRKGWKAQAIHGDKNQYARSDALASFKDGSIPLLIATDVAARGLDIPDVEYVINYTFPLTIEDYVHRIGRTGRAGKLGISHTFFTLHDKSHAGALVNVLREANQNVPEELTKFGTHVKKKEHGLYGAHFKDVNTNSKGTHMKFD